MLCCTEFEDKITLLKIPSTSETGLGLIELNWLGSLPSDFHSIRRSYASFYRRKVFLSPICLKGLWITKITSSLRYRYYAIVAYISWEKPKAVSIILRPTKQDKIHDSYSKPNQLPVPGEVINYDGESTVNIISNCILNSTIISTDNCGAHSISEISFSNVRRLSQRPASRKNTQNKWLRQNQIQLIHLQCNP